MKRFSKYGLHRFGPLPGSTPAGMANVADTYGIRFVHAGREGVGGVTLERRVLHVIQGHAGRIFRMGGAVAALAQDIAMHPALGIDEVAEEARGPRGIVRHG